MLLQRLEFVTILSTLVAETNDGLNKDILTAKQTEREGEEWDGEGGPKKERWRQKDK